LAIEERDQQDGGGEPREREDGSKPDRRDEGSGRPERDGHRKGGVDAQRKLRDAVVHGRRDHGEGEPLGAHPANDVPGENAPLEGVPRKRRPATEASRVPAVPPDFRCGFVAIAGEPNVGKSTLTNRLLRERLSIVTAKPQTTRRKTLGILNCEGYQAVLLDTPGLMAPRYELHQAMLREAREALVDADVVLFLVEPTTSVDVPVAVRESGGRCLLVLNKVDLVTRKEDLLPILTAWNDTGFFEELVPISALEGHGTTALLDLIVPRLPLGPPFYPRDELATQPERFFVGEIIRERIFERFEMEIPYATEVTVEEFHERPGAKDYIEALIHVEQESQKAILIGAEGAAIRGLGEEARGMIEEFLGRPVYLSLRVRVTPKWRKRPDALRRFGYHG
jgi:GTP-binding protein Era